MDYDRVTVRRLLRRSQTTADGECNLFAYMIRGLIAATSLQLDTNAKKKMLHIGIFISIAIVLIALINYFGLMFYVVFGLVLVCITLLGPSILYYGHMKLSPTYPQEWKYFCISTAVCLVSVLFYFDLLAYVLCGLLIACGILLGPTIVIYMNNILSLDNSSNSKGLKRSAVNKLNAFEILLLRESFFIDEARRRDPTRYPLIISRLVDGALQNLLDLSFRDFIGWWLNEMGIETDELIGSAKQDLWEAIQKIHSRTQNIDHTNLVACSIVNAVTSHFEKIRKAQENAIEGEEPTYSVFPHLLSNEGELEYLRRVSEVFILFFMPRDYTFTVAKCLLREVIACKILSPVINGITDPDYINRKILSYIQQQQMAEALHRKTCEYADSFEDFIAMIKTTQDLEDLKRIRYSIVSEIMQATTTQNIQRAQGLDPENNTMIGKSDLVQGKRLKRYISQLTFAKKTCECHMQALGWDGYPMEDDEVIDPMSPPDNRIIPLRTILGNVIGRKYLSQFLEQVSSQGLVGYYTAVQELRASDKSSWHQLGVEIFYTYITIPTTEIKVDKDTRKRMESFLLGDTGPDVFYEVQETVIQTIEEKYYPSFLVTEHYKKLLEETSDENLGVLIDDKRSLVNGTIPDNTSLLVGEHSSYARKKFDQLQEKLNNKIQAWKALEPTLKSDNKVLEILAKEIDWLQGEKQRLEAHLNRTDKWAEHLGHWKVTVDKSEFPENEPPQFVLIVHEVTNEADETSISSGWVVMRKLPEFQELHKKLRQLCPSIKNVELPSQPLKFFGKIDKNVIDKAKAQVQKYLNFVLRDDRLNQSEALYAFLCPSSEQLKSNIPSPKKSRFSLSTLFKSNSGSSGEGGSREKDEDDDYSLLLDDNEPIRSVTEFLGPGKDSIAEPLYTLLGEVFDLRGVFRWLRRSLITFVQLTYGRTINRQVRDTVAWMFSEPMLHYYIQLLVKSWWPNGQLATEVPVRTEEDKIRTRAEARRQFLNSVPDFLTNLVGAQSAERGAMKVFDSLQNVQLNKQLFYDIFEVVMFEMFPELKKDKD